MTKNFIRTVIVYCFILGSSNSFALDNPFLGLWSGLENNQLSIKKSPIREDNYSISFTSTRRGESFSSDICVFDEQNQQFLCVDDVHIRYNPKEHSFTVRNQEMIIETYYDASKQEIVDNLLGVWHSQEKRNGQACTITIKPDTDYNVWPGTYYAVYFNNENIPYRSAPISTNNTNYMLELGYTSAPQYTLTLDADPVRVSRICFGPGINSACSESACYEKVNG